jgi:hypothetical protein
MSWPLQPRSVTPLLSVTDEKIKDLDIKAEAKPAGLDATGTKNAIASVRRQQSGGGDKTVRTAQKKKTAFPTKIAPETAALNATATEQPRRIFTFPSSVFFHSVIGNTWVVCLRQFHTRQRYYATVAARHGTDGMQHEQRRQVAAFCEPRLARGGSR